MTDLILGGSKITADGDCSHEIKRRLLLGSKALTNLDSILKSRDVTLPTNVHLVKAMIFPVVTYGCESWTIKTAEQQRIDAFELWCWRRIFLKHKFIYFNWRLITLQYCIGEDSWESLGLKGDPSSPSWRKSVLSIHWKVCCWSWSSNTLAAWCEELTHWKRPWSWEWLKAGGEGDDRGWGG